MVWKRYILCINFIPISLILELLSLFCSLSCLSVACGSSQHDRQWPGRQVSSGSPQSSRVRLYHCRPSASPPPLCLSGVPRVTSVLPGQAVPLPSVCPPPLCVCRVSLGSPRSSRVRLYQGWNFGRFLVLLGFRRLYSLSGKYSPSIPFPIEPEIPGTQSNRLRPQFHTESLIGKPKIRKRQTHGITTKADRSV